MEIMKLPITDLKPAGYNPRKNLKSGDPEYEKLKRSFQEFGYVEPIVWNRQTQTVVGGHQRLKVLAEMGETEIECVIVDMPQEKEKALNIALNKINGQWDEELLANLLKDLESQAVDLAITGFDTAEIESLMKQFDTSETRIIIPGMSRSGMDGTVALRGDARWRIGNNVMYGISLGHRFLSCIPPQSRSNWWQRLSRTVAIRIMWWWTCSGAAGQR